VCFYCILFLYCILSVLSVYCLWRKKFHHYYYRPLNAPIYATLFSHQFHIVSNQFKCCNVVILFRLQVTSKLADNFTRPSDSLFAYVATDIRMAPKHTVLTVDVDPYSPPMFIHFHEFQLSELMWSLLRLLTMCGTARCMYCSAQTVTTRPRLA